MTLTEERLTQIAARLADLIEMDQSGYELSVWLALKAILPDCRDLLGELRATREQRDAFKSLSMSQQEELGVAEARVATLRAALERAKAFLLLARHPDLLGVLDAYSTIVDALAATTEGQP